MKTRDLGRFLIAVVLTAGASMAESKEGTYFARTDQQISDKVYHEVLMYPFFTIWDEVSFRVDNGQVQLLGEVTQPRKKSDVGRLVQHIAGVTSVTNDIRVLPLSPMDNQLRRQVARAIYGYPALSRYGLGAQPSIHIIVDSGHITLSGVVATDFDKQIAGMRAGSAGLSLGPVVNNLEVEHPQKKN